MIFSNRRIRAVGPLILLLVTFATFGALRAPYLLFSSYTESLTLTQITINLLGAKLALYGAQILGFVSCGTAAWSVLKYVRERYERKELSDQSILLGAVWLEFAGLYFIDLAFEGYAWILGVIPAFMVYLLLVRVGFALLRRRSKLSNRARRLLVLRVFALETRSELIFEAVSRHWRMSEV